MTRTDGRSSVDAFAPPEIAARTESLGVGKVRAPFTTVFVLSVLAGAFISLGAITYLVAMTGSADVPLGLARLCGGFVFCLGLILVVVAGAELFTGNNLVAMAWASRRIATRELFRNWVLVYLGNVVGCIGTVALVWAADVDALGGGELGRLAVAVAGGKAKLGWGVAFARGVLCNALVCLAVWLAMGGRTVTDKILAIVFPITAFVAIGLEHSIANWFFLPYGIALAGEAGVPGSVARNLIAVTAGNIVGGTLLVAGVYWVAYLRPKSAE